MAAVLAVILALVALLWFGQRWLIYFPLGDPPPPAAVGLPGAEVVSFTTEDGLRLEAWFVPPAGPPTGQTVIVFNGNGGHRALRARLAAALAARGFACLLTDYRGYGGNPGLPSERGLARDARAARAYAAMRRDVDPDRLVYFGESLGSAVAVRLATEHPPEALVLRSPITSLVEMGEHHYPIVPARLLLRERYPAVDLIRAVQAPVLIIAGDRDRIVPIEFSERLYEAANEPKALAVIEGAEHNDLALLDGDDMLDAIEGFLGRTRQYRIQ
jgi:fermentation-respiration switch protein FrsA (DUF1100 family)